MTAASPRLKYADRSRGASFALILVVYLLGLLIAVVTYRALVSMGMGPMLSIALADVAATVVVFVGSWLLDNSSVYDPYWSVVPPLIAGFLALSAPDEATVRAGLAVALLSVWGVRLTYNWARGFPGLRHEDWRYTHFRVATGRWYWAVSFAGIHLFPTVQVLLACLPLWPIMTRPTALNGLDFLGGGVMTLAIVIEAVADQQLNRFAKRKKEPGEVLEEGLWAHSRHPNYLGEILLWVGLFILGLAADRTAWWCGAGALAIIVMFRGVSIPLIEKRMLDRRPGFAKVIARVPMLLPFGRRRGA